MRVAGGPAMRTRGIEREQQRRAIADGRGGGEVAAERRAIADERRGEEVEPFAERGGRGVPERVDFGERESGADFDLRRAVSRKTRSSSTASRLTRCGKRGRRRFDSTPRSVPPAIEAGVGVARRGVRGSRRAWRGARSLRRRDRGHAAARGGEAVAEGIGGGAAPRESAASRMGR